MIAPLSVKKELLISPSPRSFIYFEVKFFRGIPQNNLNLKLPFVMPKIEYIPSPINCGLGDFHFKRILNPVYQDKFEPFNKIYNITQKINNFDFNLVKHICETSRKTSAGGSYGRPYKYDNIVEMLQYYRNFHPCDVWTIITYREKQELLPLTKIIERKKTRLFAACDFHAEVIFRIFFLSAFNILMQKHPRVWKIGYSMYHSGPKYMFGSLLNKLNNFISMDAQDCDSTLSLSLMCYGTDLMLRTANYNQTEIFYCIYLVIIFLKQPRKFENFVFSIKGALPSGWFLTSLLTSFVVLFVLTSVFQTTIPLLSNLAFNAGDDLLLHRSLVNEFSKKSKIYGLNYMISEKDKPYFLSCEYIKVPEGIIARPVRIGKLWANLAFYSYSMPAVMRRNFFFSLFLLYFYYFEYHHSKYTYLRTFFNFYSYYEGYDTFLLYFKKWRIQSLNVWFTDQLTFNYNFFSKDGTTDFNNPLNLTLK
jgi:hypothetical protein